ncbi:cytochrome c [Rhodobacterales bacterium HKCCE2091]|nr:cytochrome c [Rhodobacterales bacterium HKCCE2091]
MRNALACGCAAAGIALAGAAGVHAQDPAPYMTGETRPAEMLEARRILMDTIGRNNDFLHDSVDGHFEWDGVSVRARLDAMSSMLFAFPHLYHPGTDIWSEAREAEDAASVSLSTAAAWEDFEGFYALAQEASMTALEASLAHDDDVVIALIEELESQCEACHEVYRQDRASGRASLSTGSD